MMPHRVANCLETPARKAEGCRVRTSSGSEAVTSILRSLMISQQDTPANSVCNLSAEDYDTSVERQWHWTCTHHDYRCLPLLMTAWETHSPLSPTRNEAWLAAAHVHDSDHHSSKATQRRHSACRRGYKQGWEHSFKQSIDCVCMLMCWHLTMQLRDTQCLRRGYKHRYKQGDMFRRALQTLHLLLACGYWCCCNLWVSASTDYLPSVWVTS
jgi:hypothetical protein